MVLDLKNVSKIFGNSCPNCLTNTGANFNSSICPSCKSVVGVNSVNLNLKKGEVLGIVGESGSGKSTLLQLIYQDQKATSGEIFVKDFIGKNGDRKNILDANLNELSFLRNSLMSMIYQNPRLGLNYNFSAGGNIAQKVIMSGNKKYDEIRQKALYFLEKTEIPISRIDDYPEYFSGGQQQRIQISKALSSSPKILLLDEPTTGLDLSVQAKILDLIKELQHEIGFAMVVVSHDLGVIKHLTDITVVMKNGQIVEQGLTDQILEDPQHPYTQLLVSSIL
ncbi:ATP-binding cassette domain-containing protein [Halarcobacter anaerophilus]|uniref:Phosphonate C-P lyase system protein PhnK n=1 Tax=Halarcobacter anaerophilus TaxID=877500 RepID=A0A4Q0Y0P9_9BACT|nr:ATP-binding cassette domain-containing protein [Halarcobacter anaerophilus]QDF28892.1 carbon-phosphorus lyase subunit PhnK [Halarcobacter anaerophilus]RXJ63532.1 phosphonate C-P lyase system protein PhnK [Halarcobacter anaerophilus]